jgi:hypothetical protein
MFTKEPYEEFFRYCDYDLWLDPDVSLVSGTVVVTEKQTLADTSSSMVSDVAVYSAKKLVYKVLGGVSGRMYLYHIRAIDDHGQKWEFTTECKVT